MNIAERNLKSLEAAYRKTRKVTEGYNALKKLITGNDYVAIDWLLRHHNQGGVYDKELKTRFKIDALIEYYNLLTVAAIAGFIPIDFDKRNREEISEIIGCNSVRPYYESRYPYFLTQVTLNYCNVTNKEKLLAPSLNSSVLFNEFLVINSLIKEDKDVICFLGMLDYVTYKDINVNDLIEILKDANRLSNILSKMRYDDIESKSVWGFVKYTQFLTRFRLLLNKTGHDPLLASAMWQYHGYYFNRLSETLKRFFDEAMRAMKSALSELKVSQQLLKEDDDERVTEKELRSLAKETVERTREDVMFVLNPEFATALEEFNLRLLSKLK